MFRKILRHNYKLKVKYLLREPVILFAIMVLATGLRLIGIQSESLRLDETQSIWQASHSIPFITQYMLKNVHLPLHNSLLHYWILYFGSDVYMVRLLALIPGILTIPAIYYLSSEVIGKDRSKYTMLIAALSPIWVWYSREIRMYTLLIFITTLSYLFFIRTLKRNKLIDYFFYVIVNIVGVYTHYFFLLVLLVQAVFFIISSRSMSLSEEFKNFNVTSRFLKLVICAVLIGLTFFPWVRALIMNYGSGTYAPELATPIPFNIIQTYFEYIGGFLPDSIGSILLSVWPISIFFGFIFLTKRQNPFSYTLFLVVLGTILPILLGYTFSVVVKSVFLSRYFIIVTPMLYIFMAWYLTELRGVTRNILVCMFFLLMAVMLYVQQNHMQNPARENYKDAIAFIENNADSRDIVLLTPAYTIYPFQYYYNGLAKATTFPIWDKKEGAIPIVSEELLRSDIEILRKGHSKFYVLITDNLSGALDVKSFMDANYTKLEKVQFSKHIWVEVYQAEYL